MRGLNVLFLQAGFQNYDDGHNDECCADVRHINPEIAVLPQSGVIFVCSQLWISTVYIYRVSQKKWCIAISNIPVVLDVQIF